MELKFYSDSGHGWLRVTKSLLKELGIADKISNCSYQDCRGFAYLEEDCDMNLFLKSWKESGREEIVFDELVTEQGDSPVRNYERYKNG